MENSPLVHSEASLNVCKLCHGSKRVNSHGVDIDCPICPKEGEKSSMISGPVKLNLGCGPDKMPGWINVDFYAEADENVNLNSYPWPWETGSVDVVAMFHVLEHLEDRIQAIREVHRILKDKGEFWLKVPHFQDGTACAMDHRHYFSYWAISSLFTKGKESYLWGQPQLFENVYYKARIFNLPFIKWTPFDWLASRFPRVWEKINLIGIAEIEWKGRAIKNA